MYNKKDELAELRDLVYKYLSKWPYFVIAVLLCLGGVFAYLKITEPVYNVTANVLIKEDESDPIKSAGMMKSMGFGFPGSMDVNDELYTMSSFSITREAIDSLKLYTEYYEKIFPLKSIDRYAANEILISLPPLMKDTLESSFEFDIQVDENGLAAISVFHDEVGEIFEEDDLKLPTKISTDYGDFLLSTTSNYNTGDSFTYKVFVSGLDATTENYMKELNISLADKKSNVLSLAMQHSNVDKSKDLLNVLIALYNIDAVLEKNYMATNTSKFIKERLDVIAAELSVAETEVEQFKKKNNILDLKLESEKMLEQSADLQNSLVEVSTQLTIVDQILDQLKKKKSQYDLLPTSIGIKDASATSAIADYNTLLLERIKILETSSLSNPVLINIDNKITALRSNVISSIQNVRTGLETSKIDLTNQLNRFYARFEEAPTIEKEFLDIRRNQLIKEKLVLFLMEKREENALSLAMAAPKAKIIDSAYKHSKPVAPNKIKLIGIALILGVLIPFIYIYIKDLLVTTFDSKDELEKLTVLPVLGEICQSSKKEGSVVVTKGSVTSVTELFRLIRTNLQFVLNRKDEKVILITSTRSGEGKSFFSLNLALTLALTGKKVLLMGLDIRSPKLAEYIGLPEGAGITNYLSNEDIQVSDILTKGVHHEGLDVMISGPVPPNPGELLLSNRLDNLFTELRESYDYILVDSAPVGMVADSFLLTRVVDMTVYVMRAKYTHKNSISFAENLYQQERLKKPYLVLNGTETKKGYGYGYGNKPSEIK